MFLGINQVYYWRSIYKIQNHYKYLQLIFNKNILQKIFKNAKKQRLGLADQKYTMKVGGVGRYQKWDMRTAIKITECFASVNICNRSKSLI